MVRHYCPCGKRMQKRTTDIASPAVKGSKLIVKCDATFIKYPNFHYRSYSVTTHETRIDGRKGYVQEKSNSRSRKN